MIGLPRAIEERYEGDADQNQLPPVSGEKESAGRSPSRRTPLRNIVLPCSPLILCAGTGISAIRAHHDCKHLSGVYVEYKNQDMISVTFIEC